MREEENNEKGEEISKTMRGKRKLWEEKRTFRMRVKHLERGRGYEKGIKQWQEGESNEPMDAN